MRWHGPEGMLCLVLVVSCDPEDGRGEDDALHDGGAGEGNAEKTAELCFSEARQGADGGELYTHKRFTESED